MLCFWLSRVINYNSMTLRLAISAIIEFGKLLYTEDISHALYILLRSCSVSKLCCRLRERVWVNTSLIAIPTKLVCSNVATSLKLNCCVPLLAKGLCRTLAAKLI